MAGHTPKPQRPEDLAKPIEGGDLQDGMLVHFNAEAPKADANVEAQIKRETNWQLRDLIRRDRGEPR